MTKEEYLAWNSTRGDDAAEWDIAKCRAADNLIKNAALDRAARWIGKNVHSDAQNLLLDFVKTHYGSVEVDSFLQKINAYPEWMV